MSRRKARKAQQKKHHDKYAYSDEVNYIYKVIEHPNRQTQQPKSQQPVSKKKKSQNKITTPDQIWSVAEEVFGKLHWQASELER